MSDLYKSLCLELDQLLIDIIDDMEKYIVAKIDLEKSMNDGFVHIAKARYINGTSSVTSLQLPTENSDSIQPQALVIRTPDSVHVENALLTNKKSQSDNQGVKNRKDEKTEPTIDDRKSNDPIRLFGVLVPQALKNAQKSFILSVDKVGSVASVEGDLDAKLNRYLKLLKFKKQLTC